MFSHMFSHMFSKKIVVAATLILAASFLCAGYLTAQTPMEKNKTGTASKENKEARGKEVFDKVISAMGGTEKFSSVKNFAFVTQTTRVGLKDIFVFDVLAIIEFPGKLLYTAIAPGGVSITAVDGEEGWIEYPPSPRQKMAQKDVKAIHTTILREMVYLFSNTQKYKISLTGEKMLYRKKVLTLHFSGPTEFDAYVDPKTHLIAGYSFYETTQTDAKPVFQEELYYDYREINGLKWPYHVVSKTGGHIASAHTIQVLKLNIPFEKDFFKGNLNKKYEDMIESRLKQYK